MSINDDFWNWRLRSNPEDVASAAERATEELVVALDEEEAWLLRASIRHLRSVIRAATNLPLYKGDV